MDTQSGIDIFSAGFKDHAFASYAQLRREDPVLMASLQNEQTLGLVMRYSDAAIMMKDYSRFGNDIANAFSEADLEGMRAQFLAGMSEEQAQQMLELDQLFGTVLDKVLHYILLTEPVAP